MYDLGGIYPAGVTVRDDDGNPVNAGLVAFTFALPDGTSAPVTPTNPSTGRYEHDYPITQYGLHRFRALSTSPATAYADVFNVASSDWPAFVGLAEVKNHLNIPATNTTHDDELRGFVLSASEVVEGIVGKVARRTVTETYSGRRGVPIRLRQWPVVSVTGVTENGEALAADDWSLSEAGLLYRVSGYTDLSWTPGRNNIAVTYVPGRAATPWSVVDATKELIKVNWRPQQGGNYSPFDGGRADDVGLGVGVMRLGFFVPNTVTQRLQPHGLGAVVF